MDLSILILSYNTKETTLRCLRELDTLASLNSDVRTEVIVVDNASSDGSVESLQRFVPAHYPMRLILNTDNVGFSKGNNIALAQASGTYILYLNSDVMVFNTARPLKWSTLLSYFDHDTTLGALTVRVDLAEGSIDPACHRGFPTPWRSFTYFVGLEQIAARLPLKQKRIRKWLGGYHMLHEDVRQEHFVEAGTAAFLLCRADVLRKLGGFDEQFFMYGEDLDLCRRMYDVGRKIWWTPTFTVTHLKYQSGLNARDNKTKRRIRWHFYDAMLTFYAKHYARVYCPCINILTQTVLRIMRWRFRT